jgi:hypothetical protein
MEAGKVILLKLEKDIERLESFLEDYRTITEEITGRWGKEKPLFAKDFEETIMEREKQIMEALSFLYIEKENRFSKDS